MWLSVEFLFLSKVTFGYLQPTLKFWAQLHTKGQGFDSPLRHLFQSVFIMIEIDINENVLA